MIFAIPYQDGNIAESFAACTTFRMYNAEEGRLVACMDLEVPEESGVKLAYLIIYNIRCLVCGNIGEEVERELNANGILTFPGYAGSADEVASLFAQSMQQAIDGADTYPSSHACGGCGSCGGGCGCHGAEEDEGCGACGCGGGCHSEDEAEE